VGWVEVAVTGGWVVGLGVVVVVVVVGAGVVNAPDVLIPTLAREVLLIGAETNP